SRMARMSKSTLPEPLAGLQRQCPAVGLMLLRRADGGPLRDSFVHLFGGEQRPDRHASITRGIRTQLGGSCGDFIGVVDNRVGGGRAVIKIPKFELASDRLDKLGNTCFERCGLLYMIDPLHGPNGQQLVSTADMSKELCR